ncbi:hypothetical protein Lal_00031258 [Lupinus albus]|nr:hypothetical protein Lal_00031258 [Lupinus albus]
MVEKLKGVMVGKRGGDGGPFTPLHAWRLELPSQKNGDSTSQNEHTCFTKVVSEPPDRTSDKPASASSWKRHVAELLVQHHRSIERNGCTLQLESPASYSSSVDAQMKELLQEKQMNMQEIENIMKHMTVDNIFMKNKERDRFKAVVRSIREELEDERRLRKYSERLHRKLAQELSEYSDNGLDKVILHISEAWLDERMQMKQTESGNDLIERNSIVDKLGFDIETFPHAKRSFDLKKYGYSSPKELKEIHPCQHSFDCFLPKESTSAPQNMAEEDSIDTDFYEPKRVPGEELHKLSSRLFHCCNITTEIHLEKNGKPIRSKEIADTVSCDDNKSYLAEKK